MTRVPALFQNGQVYLKVSLGKAAPVWMAFDLNAPVSTLYAAHAMRATVQAGVIASKNSLFVEIFSLLAGLRNCARSLCGTATF